MKRLSDYKGDEAILLWGDLFEWIIPILGDDDIKNVVRGGQPKEVIAKTIIKKHSKEVEEILLRIDPTPIDGLNIVFRFVKLLEEIGSNETVKGFFGFAEQANNESSGSVTVNTEDEEK